MYLCRSAPNSSRALLGSVDFRPTFGRVQTKADTQPGDSVTQRLKPTYSFFGKMILFCFFVSKNYWRWKVILRFSFWKFAQRPPTKLSTMVTNNNTDALFFWWAHILAMIMLFQIECYWMWYVENKIFKWFSPRHFQSYGICTRFVVSFKALHLN